MHEWKLENCLTFWQTRTYWQQLNTSAINLQYGNCLFVLSVKLLSCSPDMSRAWNCCRTVSIGDWASRHLTFLYSVGTWHLMMRYYEMLLLLLICRCRWTNYQRYWWETANFQAQLKFYKYRQCAVIRHTCVIEKIHFANFKPLIFKYFCSLFIIYSLQLRANVKRKLKLARYVFMGHLVKTRESLYWCGRIIFL